MNLKTLTMAAAGEMLAAGKISSLELCQAYLDRIAAMEPKVAALLSLDTESVLAEAAGLFRWGSGYHQRQYCGERTALHLCLQNTAGFCIAL